MPPRLERDAWKMGAWSGNRRLPQRPEELPYLLDEQVRLLERSEMAALRHFAPVPDIRVARFHPFSHRRNDFLGEDSDSGRHRDLVGGPALRSKTLPVQTGRRGS